MDEDRLLQHFGDRVVEFQTLFLRDRKLCDATLLGVEVVGGASTVSLAKAIFSSDEEKPISPPIRQREAAPYEPGRLIGFYVRGAHTFGIEFTHANDGAKDTMRIYAIDNDTKPCLIQQFGGLRKTVKGFVAAYPGAFGISLENTTSSNLKERLLWMGQRSFMGMNPTPLVFVPPEHRCQ